MNDLPRPYNRSHPFLSKIKQRYDLCETCPEKNTLHIVLDLKGSGITYHVGDCVGVFPVNDHLLVSQTLEALHASGEELIHDKRSGEISLFRDFLKIKANLTDINRRLLKEIAERQTSPQKRQVMEELLQPEHKEDLKRYLHGRHYWDVLMEHHEVQFGVQEFCDLVMPLLPRFYSIASSQKAVNDEVHLTVKLLAYEAHGHTRKGVCTHYLCTLVPAEESIIPLYIQPHSGFTVPEDPDAAMIMIGPGTGVAPFRAFMQERIATGARGKNWLFFGEWRKEHNFLYGDYWLSLEKEGILKVDLAFSRDQEEKIYVQHRLIERGDELFHWLQEGAYLYVCGDAQNMARDVDEALHQIVMLHGKLSEAEAKAYLKELRKNKRYLKDVY